MPILHLEDIQKKHYDAEAGLKARAEREKNAVNGFLPHIHAFRSLAIAYIIAGHSIDFFTWNVNDRQLEKLLRIVFSNGSVLFVFIAGYLFQHLLSNYSPKKYLLSKIRTVAMPYFFVSLPAIVLFTFFMTRETMWAGFYNHSKPIQWILFLLTGKHLTPLWFIPMIMIYYFLAPLFAAFDKSKFFYYPLPLFLLISFLVPRGTAIHNIIHFFSIYVLGMFFSHYKYFIEPRLSKPIFLTTLFVIAILLILYESQGILALNGGVNFLQKTVISVFFLCLLYNYRNRLELSFVHLIGHLSFGSFFIHAYVLTAGKCASVYFKGAYLEGNIYFFALATLVVLISCTYLVKGMKVFLGSSSRLVIGC